MLEAIIIILLGMFLSYLGWVYYWAWKPVNPFLHVSIKHDWEFCLKSHDEDTHREYNMLRCKACGKYKREYTGNIYNSEYITKVKSEEHKCEFCSSIETTKYPAEGQGDVYLCEDCHSRSND